MCVCGWLIERFPVGGVDHNPIQPLQDTNQPATNHQKKLPIILLPRSPYLCCFLHETSIISRVNSPRFSLTLVDSAGLGRRGMGPCRDHFAHISVAWSNFVNVFHV